MKILRHQPWSDFDRPHGARSTGLADARPSMTRPNWNRPGSHRGMVLVVVAVVILLISVSAYGFLLNMRTEYQGVKAERGRVLARQAAHSAQQLLLQLATIPHARRRELGGMEDNPRLLSPTSVLPATAPWSGSTDVPRCWVARRSLELPSGELVWGAVDESTKLHLSNLVAWDAAQPGVGRQALMRIPGMTEATADAMLDWVDLDDQPRPMGAERDYYQQLGSHYVPQNGLPWTLDQLLWVRGVDRSLLWGNLVSSATSITPAASPVAFSPAAPSTVPSKASTSSTTARTSPIAESRWRTGRADSAPVEQRPPWTHFLTLYSAERNTSSEGWRRINLNEANLASLHQQLSAKLPVEWANYIVLWRQYGPASSVESSDHRASPQVPLDFSRPASATLSSPLDLLGGGVRVEDAGRQWVGSPISSDPGQLTEELPRLLDATTTDVNDRIIGRVNVNTAPREVLLAVPKLTEDLVERIMSARTNSSGSAIACRDPAWLLTEGLVDLPTLKELLPWLTTGGDVFQAECWGYVQPRMPMAAFRAVIDGSSNPARCVDYQELAIVDRQRWDALLMTSDNSDGSFFPGDNGRYGASNLISESVATGDQHP